MLQRFYWKLYFSQLSEKGVQCRWTQIITFLTLLPHYGLTGAGSVSWKEPFHLVFMIRGQIDWSPFVFKVIQQGEKEVKTKADGPLYNEVNYLQKLINIQKAYYWDVNRTKDQERLSSW